MAEKKFSHERIDGKWTILNAQYILEIRERISPFINDPNLVPRKQYVFRDFRLLTRTLPPINDLTVDGTNNDNYEWWSPVLEYPPPGIIRAFYEFQGGTPEIYLNAHKDIQSVIAFAPDGREIRSDSRGLYLQPGGYTLRGNLENIKSAYYSLHAVRIYPNKDT